MEFCLIVGLILVIGYCGYKLAPNLINKLKSDTELTAIAEIIDKDSLKKAFTQKSYDALKQENEDFIGYLEFDSGIISLPVMQADDNNYYLRKSFYKEYNEEGIPFMDASCTLDSTNIIIYGHNVYYDDSAMFSPLSFLTEQDKFEESQTFSFYLDGEIRTYQITNVYEIDIYSSNFDFQKTDFADEEEFLSWYQTPINKNLIKTNEKLEYGDNFITFQTCKRFFQNSRILVVAKEIGRTSY